MQGSSEKIISSKRRIDFLKQADWEPFGTVLKIYIQLIPKFLKVFPQVKICIII